MSKRDQVHPSRTHEIERRARIERLLFAGATLATTALTPGNVVDPKIPWFVGE